MTLVYAKIINMCRAGAGGWGSRGGTWKFSKLGPTHTWLSVGGGGVCTYIQLGGRGRDQGGVSECETSFLKHEISKSLLNLVM